MKAAEGDFWTRTDFFPPRACPRFAGRAAGAGHSSSGHAHASTLPAQLPSMGRWSLHAPHTDSWKAAACLAAALTVRTPHLESSWCFSERQAHELVVAEKRGASVRPLPWHCSQGGTCSTWGISSSSPSLWESAPLHPSYTHPQKKSTKIKTF